MSTVENKGNQITRFAFSGEQGTRSRIDDLARICHIEGTSAYRHMAEFPPFGSGRRSTLFIALQIVEFLEEADKKEGLEISTAMAYAEAPLIHLAQLRGGIAAGGDQAGKVNLLMKCVADANFVMRARLFEEMTPNDLREFARNMLSAATLARELCAAADETRRNMEAAFPGAQRLSRATG